MSEALLGCPHCTKPVGFAPAMAGQVVACPHCRGQFQMPERPPASGRLAPPRREAGLSFDGVDSPAGPAVKAELDSYRAAVTLANVFAMVGSAAVLLVIGLTVYPFVSGRSVSGLVAFVILIVIASAMLAALAIIGLFLVRACTLVVVDAARTLRAIERDAAVVRKAK